MAFEMRQTDDDIRIHYSASNLRLFYVISIHRYQYIVRAFQPISNQYLTARGKKVEAVFKGSVQMV